MNMKLIETLLIALLPLFAATSAAQASAAGPMLRNLEEDALVSINRTGKSTCDAQPDLFLVILGARQLRKFIFDQAGLSAIGPGFIGDDEIWWLRSVVGSKVWECIIDACSFNGSAELQVDAVCILDGLIDFLEAADRERLAEILEGFISAPVV